MKFSLITGTIGEIEELRDLLESLRNQNASFELILIDQSKDKEVKTLCDRYKNIEIVCVKSDEKGLSRARNTGLARVKGDVICFPDADCRFPPKLLSKIESFFRKHPDADALVVNVGITKEGPFEEYLKKKRNSIGVLPFKDWYWVRSMAIFVKKHVADEVGNFDEDLGVGAKFGSGEESDYVYRILEAGFKIYYNRDLYVQHELDSFSGENPPKRAYYYGLGHGALLKKHLWYRRKWHLSPFFFRMLIRPLGGMILGFLDKTKRTFYWNSIKGRIRGFLEY